MTDELELAPQYTGPPGLARHPSVWSMRELMGPIPSQRQATFRTL